MEAGREFLSQICELQNLQNKQNELFVAERKKLQEVTLQYEKERHEFERLQGIRENLVAELGVIHLKTLQAQEEYTNACSLLDSITSSNLALEKAIEKKQSVIDRHRMLFQREKERHKKLKREYKMHYQHEKQPQWKHIKLRIGALNEELLTKQTQLKELRGQNSESTSLKAKILELEKRNESVLQQLTHAEKMLEDLREQIGVHEGLQEELAAQQNSLEMLCEDIYSTTAENIHLNCIAQHLESLKMKSKS